MKFYHLLLSLLLAPLTGFPQPDTKQPEVYTDTTTNYIEFAGIGSNNGYTPFWLQANQFGIVPVKSPLGSVRAALEHYFPLSVNTGRNVWRFGGGIEAVGNFGEENKVLFPQLHATLKFKNWELFVGRKKQWVGLADSTISSGSYSWSGNALPIPKISIGTTRFVPVPFTKKWISFNAFYSDGLFEKGRPVTSELKLHQKALYIRIGKATSRFKLYGGFNHQVQWGGKTKYWTSENNEMPSGFKNYLKVVTGSIGGSGDKVTYFDSTSRVGNHLGSIDVAMEIETYGASLLFYRQFLYEDGSLFYLKGISDGLYGIRLKRKNSYGANFEIREAVFEYLDTKNQAGDNFVLMDGKQRGHDNYFNNQQVRDAWGYFDRTIGTPFIPPTSQTIWKYPQYADNFTSNNRVLLFHLGLTGTLFRHIDWYGKFSYSRNWGTWVARFNNAPSQFSGVFGLQSTLNVLGGLTIKGAYAVDNGDLYRKTNGFMLGLRKDFSFY